MQRVVKKLFGETSALPWGSWNNDQLLPGHDMNKKMDLSKIKHFNKCAQASTSSPGMEIVITPRVDPKKQPAVEGLNHETTRGCNLQTKNSTSSRTDQLKASAKASSLYGGDSAKGDTTPSRPKGRQQNTDFSKVGLRKKKAASESDVPEHADLRSIQEMLNLLKAFPRSFPQRRVYHLPSHSIGYDHPELQPLCSAGLYPVTPLPRGQVQDKRFSPVTHRMIRQIEDPMSWPSLSVTMDESDSESCYLTGGPPNTPEMHFKKKTANKSTGTLMLNDEGQSESIDSLMRNTNFESQWAPEFYYPLESTLGPKQSTRLSYPSYTIGQRIHARPARRAHPSPTYDIVLADRLVLQNSASYSIGRRLQGIWKGTGLTPGPCAYDVHRSSPMIRHCHPSYSIRGARREKRHDLGPFTTF
ncbi:uncharacterized protein LOC119955717 isoform X2 [Scyliorhinus canicula]|uniref:uncharacterized protein LOC119955717 isoform X2 n=1 Tax=Scyliorhinus canicula TaxID=7830 RepID=UPI0018F341E5|nr:uncharacterized protein LOC119955717 isoform X2 [Scyliorhinus canicula]